MQQEALATLFISCKQSPDVTLASWEICLTRTWLHALCLSPSSSTLFVANFLHSTFSWILNCHLKVVQNLIYWVDFPKDLIVGLALDTLCFWKVQLLMFFAFHFFCVQDILSTTQLSRAVQGLISGQTEKRGDTMSTLRRSMIRLDAEPPSVAAASVVSGDVMEIAKLMLLLICITLTACGLYRNICRPRADRSQASSSPTTSTPAPPTEAMG